MAKFEELRKVYIGIDQEKCNNCGACYSNYDEYFGEEVMPDETRTSEPVEIHQSKLEEVVGICPFEAITIEETK